MHSSSVLVRRFRVSDGSFVPTLAADKMAPRYDEFAGWAIRVARYPHLSPDLPPFPV